MHEMTCWECHGSGVVASEDAKPIPCPLCRDDYGRLKVVPASQLAGAVNLDDEAVIERATRALCDEEWWEDDWMTAMNVVGIVFQAAKGGQ
jgi:hypothetical protein